MYLFFSNMTYVINDHHAYQVILSAEVIKKHLYISKTILKIGYPVENDPLRILHLPILLENKLQVSNRFFWDLNNTGEGPYTVEPRSGI